MVGPGECHVACDLCGGDEPELLYRKTRAMFGPVVRCRRCGLMYVNPRRGAFTLDYSHPSYVEEQVSEEFRAKQLDQRPQYERVVDTLLEMAPGRRLLEIGASIGVFLALAAEKGFDCVGVEPQRHAAKIAVEEMSVDVRVGVLADVDLGDQPFDVVCMFHVIEHLESPRAELGRIADRLRSGGVLVVETPRFDTLWHRILRGRERNFAGSHLYFFTTHTLRRLIEECGYQVRSLQATGRTIRLGRLGEVVGGCSRAAGRGVSALVRCLRLEDRIVHINVGDLMTAYAVKR
jgi:2-polyprenyl-3-methyl-5-hydroxy-6-metoxy-1,4-benzoquinol methylase